MTSERHDWSVQAQTAVPDPPAVTPGSIESRTAELGEYKRFYKVFIF